MRILVFTLCLFLLFATTSTAKILVTSYIAEDVRAKHIVMMEDDGTGIQTIHTDDNLNPLAARWAPDGKQIVFYRFRKPGDAQSGEIVLINSDGTNERLLTRGMLDRHPVFSPDGQSVMFPRTERIDNENKDSICILNLGSGKIKKITDFAVNFPDWSPDGKQIVYSPITKIGNFTSTLWIMDANGRHPRELLPPPPQGGNGISRSYARWSPNGKQIVFSEYEFKYNPQIGFIPQANRYFIYDLRTRKTEQLRIPKTYKTSGLDWMDNGKAILFSVVEVELNGVRKHNPYHIYKYHVVTKRLTRLSEKTWVSPHLDWISDAVLPVSPKGKKKVTWGTLKQ